MQVCVEEGVRGLSLCVFGKWGRRTIVKAARTTRKRTSVLQGQPAHKEGCIHQAGVKAGVVQVLCTYWSGTH